MFGADGLHGELVTGMMRHFFQSTLGYVGTSVLDPFVAYHVPYVGDRARKALLEELRVAISAIEERPSLRMPNLDDFDEKLGPKRSLA